MIKNKFRPLPLFIYFISVVSVLFLSIRTYGLSSSLLGRLESSKIEEINYDRQIPAANKKDPIDEACPIHSVETAGFIYCMVS